MKLIQEQIRKKKEIWHPDTLHAIVRSDHHYKEWITKSPTQVLKRKRPPAGPGSGWPDTCRDWLCCEVKKENYEVFNMWQGLIIHTPDVTRGQRKGKFMWQTMISLSSPCQLSWGILYISLASYKTNNKTGNANFEKLRYFLSLF